MTGKREEAWRLQIVTLTRLLPVAVAQTLSIKRHHSHWRPRGCFHFRVWVCRLQLFGDFDQIEMHDVVVFVLKHLAQVAILEHVLQLLGGTRSPRLPGLVFLPRDLVGLAYLECQGRPVALKTSTVALT